MSSEQPIEAGNLSDAWAKAFLRAMANERLSNLTVAFSVFGERDELFCANEEPGVRHAIDEVLRTSHESSVNTIASTIFPISLWNPKMPTENLYERYKRIWPRIRRCRANYNGTYFQRMIAYGWEETKRDPERLDVLDGFNQLQHVITTYTERNNTRRSALFASITNPKVDHTDQRQRGFPCLQHVHFIPDAETQTMTITGIYATQLMIEKVYGNYLGLYRLGQFMAQGMGLKLARVVCTTSLVKLSDKKNRSDLQDLKETILRYQ